MPRPKVDRVMRSMRLRTEVDALLIKKAKSEGLSINQAVEAAVRQWVGKTQPPKRTPSTNNRSDASRERSARSRQVTPRFKK